MIVVGAGAAGLSAARVLSENNRSVAVLEARGRIGGRAFTESNTFGVPYDRGCHWLHFAAQNPWLKYGQDNGFDLYPAPGCELVTVGSRAATQRELEQFKAARQELYLTFKRTRDRDISAASVFDQRKPWHQVAANEIGPHDMGKDLEDISCIDWWNSDDGGDWFCRQGFGTLVSHFGQDIDVHLSTPVKKITLGSLARVSELISTMA